jgi:5-methylcytosine-specific restriction endonuclease McrA
MPPVMNVNPPVTFDISEVTTTVVSEGRRGRKGLTEATKEEILHGQRHNCYWCGAKLGSWVIYRSKPTLLKVHFDHVLPHSHGGSSHPSNMVASCHICNLWKGNNVFDDEEDCQDFLIKKRAIFKANGNLKVL